MRRVDQRRVPVGLRRTFERRDCGGANIHTATHPTTRGQHVGSDIERFDKGQTRAFASERRKPTEQRQPDARRGGGNR